MVEKIKYFITLDKKKIINMSHQRIQQESDLFISIYRWKILLTRKHSSKPKIEMKPFVNCSIHQ